MKSFFTIFVKPAVKLSKTGFSSIQPISFVESNCKVQLLSSYQSLPLKIIFVLGEVFMLLK